MLNPAICDQLEPMARAEALAGSATGRPLVRPTGYVGAFCASRWLEQIGAPVPKSWEDLKNPAYKGELVMPDPSSSGTGYLQIAAMQKGMGEEAAGS